MELMWPAHGAKGLLVLRRRRGESPAIDLRRPWRAELGARAASLYRSQVEMGRRGSARGSPRERCFLLGPFRSGARMVAPLRRGLFSPPLMRICSGLPVSQLRFLLTSRLAEAWLAALAAALVAGWRALARPANVLAAPVLASQVPERAGSGRPCAPSSSTALV